jgi:multiple sugar transport system permease protein
MSDARFKFEENRRSTMERLFEPPAIGKLSPVAKVVAYGILIFWTLFVLFPIYWVVITAFKDAQLVNEGPYYIPFVDFMPTLDGWRRQFVDDASKVFPAFGNSVIIAVAATALCMIVGSMAAYALARIQYKPKFGNIMIFVLITLLLLIVTSYGPALMRGLGVEAPGWVFDWRLTSAVALAMFFLLVRAVGKHFKRHLGNGDILFWIISQRILPPIVVVIPIYMMFQAVGMIDTHAALIIVYAVANLPIVVWLMHDFFANLPIELEESAQLDGATRLGIFWDIVLPLTRPGLAATTLLTLILNWNEYLFAVFLSTSQAQTMPIMVAAKNAGERGILWWEMCAIIVVMIIPVIIMAIFLQRFIAKGVLLGAVKG